MLADGLEQLGPFARLAGVFLFVALAYFVVWYWEFCKRSGRQKNEMYEKDDQRK